MTTRRWPPRVSWRSSSPPSGWGSRAPTRARISTTCLRMVGFERFRAGQFGIRHYCTIGLNSKEANNEGLAEAVMEFIPRFALKEGRGGDWRDRLRRADGSGGQVLPICSSSWRRSWTLPVMIHTPHRDKKNGTSRSMDVCMEHGLDPAHGGGGSQQRGDRAGRCWIAASGPAFSIYPSTKMGNARMVEILRQYGAKRVIVDSACDWGISEVLAVAKTAPAWPCRPASPRTRCGWRATRTPWKPTGKAAR
jgi:hypothetical protein